MKNRDHWEVQKMVSRFHEKRFGGKVKRTFLQWLVSPQEYTAKDEAMKEVWNESPFSVTGSTYRSLHEVKIKLGIERPDRRTETIRLITQRVAAVLLPVVMVLGAYFIYSGAGRATEWAAVETPNGETARYRLADGTEVWLNSGSVLEYPVRFRGKQREVRLLGEGFFAVSPDARKPFAVLTDYMKIRVRGTEFNVSCYEDRKIEQVTVLSGEVEVVTDDGGSYDLTSDRQLTLRKDGSGTTVEEVDAASVISWMNSGLVFDGHTYREILNELRRRYDISVETGTSVFTDAQYCVRFVNGEPLEHILEVVGQVTGVPYKYEDGVLTAGISAEEVRN